MHNVELLKVLRKALVVIMLGAALPLAGCYDYSEPDEKAWVLAIGVDKGRENKLTVTSVIAVPKNIAGSGEQGASGGDGQGVFFTVSIDSPTVLSNLELANTVVDRRVSLSHIKWIVFSRELAEEGIGEYVAPLVRFHQFRRSSQLIICEGRAEDFLSKGMPKMEDNVGKFYELMQRGWRFTEFIPFDSFHQFYYKSESPGVEPIAPLAALGSEEPVYPDNSPKPKGQYLAGRLPRKGGSEIEIMGGAVFKEGRMVGTLNGDEVGVQKLFFGTLKRTILDVPDPNHPDNYIIVDVVPREKPRVDITIAGNRPQISIDIKLEGGIISLQSGEDYEIPERLHIVEEAVQRAFTEDINNTIARSKQLNADFLGFGLHAQKLFPTWPQWIAFNWEDKYQEAEIVVNVDYRLRRTGLVHEMQPLR
ncbi:Ger(x)C family spore germination protein [Desulfallas thermosapovorans]|uniref:Ger(X)C family germination protein n=1 Tax=Desulfallas thermosapovorans DSM 6562 TaxID=1121431 RepID=A0A5S4ZPB7_9FIRM|nr:Ger(x)C family spore germination protein [Desulfallas thermosapovorans]TYO94706.1 Ger(x)C family germination protein [Desulfallas thermosapovorans DSM 6562]